jgi:hypothetical protein
MNISLYRAIAFRAGRLRKRGAGDAFHRRTPFISKAKNGVTAHQRILAVFRGCVMTLLNCCYD